MKPTDLVIQHTIIMFSKRKKKHNHYVQSNLYDLLLTSNLYDLGYDWFSRYQPQT